MGMGNGIADGRPRPIGIKNSFDSTIASLLIKTGDAKSIPVLLNEIPKRGVVNPVSVLETTAAVESTLGSLIRKYKKPEENLEKYEKQVFGGRLSVKQKKIKMISEAYAQMIADAMPGCTEFQKEMIKISTMLHLQDKKATELKVFEDEAMRALEERKMLKKAGTLYFAGPEV